MQSLQINTGEIRLAINEDESRVLVFNPSDVIFVEKFYKLLDKFQKSLTQYQSRFEALEKVKETDANGVPVNVEARFDVIKEVCGYIRDEIDSLFGAGTSQMVFGDSMNLDAFAQFFDGIKPFIQKARTEKIEKYTNKRPRRK